MTQSVLFGLAGDSGSLDSVPAVDPLIQRMTRKRSAVLAFLRTHSEISIPEAVELIGLNIYANKAFHVGGVLRSMVAVGLLRRLRRGVYALPA